MRRLGIVFGLAAVATLGASVPASADPPAPTSGLLVEQPTLGLDIRYVDTDGSAKVLRVEDFPR